METFDCIISRRSVRDYTDEMVKVEDLKKILEAGSYAPSGMNKQTWRFIAIQKNENIQKLDETMKEAILNIPKNNEPNKYMEYLLSKAKDPNASFFYNAKTIILVTNEIENPNAEADSALAMGNMMLMAHDLGLGSVWLNQLGGICHLPELKVLLNSFTLPTGYKVYGTLGVGYAKEKISAPLPRKSDILII